MYVLSAAIYHSMYCFVIISSLLASGSSLMTDNSKGCSPRGTAWKATDTCTHNDVAKMLKPFWTEPDSLIYVEDVNKGSMDSTKILLMKDMIKMFMKDVQANLSFKEHDAEEICHELRLLQKWELLSKTWDLHAGNRLRT